MSGVPAKQNIQVTLPAYKQYHKYSRAALAGVLDVLLSRCVVRESANASVREFS